MDSTRLDPGESSVTPTTTDNSLAPSRVLYWTMITLCVIAASLSGYLAAMALMASDVAGCGAGAIFNCEHVLTSKFSKVLGVPVSVPAFSMYASMLVGLAFFRKSTPQTLQRSIWALLTLGSISAAIAAVWFISLQVFVLEHLCQYCLGAHTCGLIMAGIVLWKSPVRMPAIPGSFALGLLGVGTMAMMQWNSEEPQQFTDTPLDIGPADTQMADAGEFAPPAEFGPPVAFAPPMEFAPPVEFEPPVEFAPPAGVLPRTETSDIQTAQFTPPLTADVSDVRQVALTDRDVAESGISPAVEEVGCEVDVPETEATEEEATEESVDTTEADVSLQMKVTSESVSWLFFPAGTQRLAARFFADDTKTDDTKTAAKDADTAKSDEAKEEPAKPKANMAIVKNQFSLNTRHWPLIGNPDAKYVFIEMFDYTCAHCRKTSKTIDGAFKKYGDDLAVVVLPVPLEKKCNPRAIGGGHVGACELAKTAIAVWRIDQKKFAEFHKWMCAQSRVPSAARKHAEELVGAEAFRKEIALPHAENYVKKHVELYGRVGSGTVPKLVFPETKLEGAITDTNYLCSKIERELGR